MTNPHFFTSHAVAPISAEDLSEAVSIASQISTGEMEGISIAGEKFAEMQDDDGNVERYVFQDCFETRLIGTFREHFCSQSEEHITAIWLRLWALLNAMRSPAIAKRYVVKDADDHLVAEAGLISVIANIPMKPDRMPKTLDIVRRLRKIGGQS